MATPASRREFLRLAAASAAAGAFPACPARAEDVGLLYRRIVPEVKPLPADWVRSLAGKGGPLDAAIATGDPAALPRIGMTVGGIACGTVYLSGDGRLFVWDIFNQPHEGVVPRQTKPPPGMVNIDKAGRMVRERDGANYIAAPTPDSHPNPFRQGFLLGIGGQRRALDGKGFRNVRFTGNWPVGTVALDDPSCPLRVTLKAWTPFVPLRVEDSSFPATVMEYTLANPGDQAVAATVAAVLENACLLFTRAGNRDRVRTRFESDAGLALLVHEPAPPPARPEPKREDIVFADFETATYEGWAVEGQAFGPGPVAFKDIPAYQGNVQGQGQRTVNSHASAPGSSVAARDNATGSLTSPEFTISRRFISLLVGGGKRPGEAAVELVVEGKAAATVTGQSRNAMAAVAIPCGDHEGKKARLRIIDKAQGPWGNIGVDQIVFTDTPPGAAVPANAPDYGSMAVACPGADARPADHDGTPALEASVTVPARGESTVTFVLAWHFANLAALPGLGRRRAHYATRFADAAAVAKALAADLPRLRAATLGWVAAWNGSTLPQWLLDRTILTTNTLQTTNCLRLDDGRFWAWEGIGACPGTCTHVWHYAQGPARLFPELERNLREATDFGVAMNPDGSVRFRAESGGIALDGQAGVVLRTWREHLGSPDDAFLKRVWPSVKRAVEWMIRFDETGRGGLDGLLDGRQHNTLDAEWYGKVPCLCSLYLAALRAAEEMAREAGDAAFAGRCRQIHALGAEKIATLFNGRFYVQEEDPAHAEAIGVGKGCHIDQVIGQWWAWQTGLGRLYNEGHIRSALHSLWHHNFVPDVGPFRKEFPKGRFYALPGEGGLVMCTWPDGGLRDDFKKHWQYAYFNECMSGFEWQAAAHMVMEGAPVAAADLESAAAILRDPADPRCLTLRGLAVARAIHDRYAPARRNPYNEIECSDHYARAAASYSMFLAATGFQAHGPRGILGFAPKIRPEDFSSAFTAAGAWGTFAQKLEDGNWTATLTVADGRLRLAELRLPWLAPAHAARLDGRAAPARAAAGRIAFAPPLVVAAGGTLEVG